jgi:hypothetical protein
MFVRTTIAQLCTDLRQAGWSRQHRLARLVAVRSRSARPVARYQRGSSPGRAVGIGRRGQYGAPARALAAQRDWASRDRDADGDPGPEDRNHRPGAGTARITRAPARTRTSARSRTTRLPCQLAGRSRRRQPGRQRSEAEREQQLTPGDRSALPGCRPGRAAGEGEERKAPRDPDEMSANPVTNIVGAPGAQRSSCHTQAGRLLFAAAAGQRERGHDTSLFVTTFG